MVIIFCLLLLGLYIVFISKEALRQSIISNAYSLSTNISKDIDRSIYQRIEIFQGYATNKLLRNFLLKSNQEFESLKDIKTVIAERSKTLFSTEKNVSTPLMQTLLSNHIADELNNMIKFHNMSSGHDVFGEVLITNRFGINVAQTNQTAEYYHADEEWWQIAKSHGLYTQDVKFDESANVSSIKIGIAVHGIDGGFLGVIKVVVSIEDVQNIINNAYYEINQTHSSQDHSDSKNYPKEVILLQNNGMILYALDGEYQTHEMHPDIELIRPNQRYYLEYLAHKSETLVVYSYSKGFKDFKGFKWIFLIEFKTEYEFAQVEKLQISILMGIAAMALFAFVFGLFLYIYISNPINKLIDATHDIGMGDFNKKLIYTSNDEIGKLYFAFNKMIIKLKQSYHKMQQQTEAATQANILKDKFVTLVAHDLRSPFNSLLGYLEYLLEDNETPLQKNHKEIIEKVIKIGYQQLEMIADILNVSRLQSGKVLAKQTFFDAHFLAKIVIDNLQPLATQKQLQLFNKIPVNTRLYADRSLVREVFHNLITNAIKFSYARHSITISVTMNSQIVFVIEDTGAGIEAEKIPKLFNIEEKTSTVGTAGEEGTGFGLPYCKDIITAHNGRITVNSKKENGSTFFVHLPIIKPRVLIVDDDICTCEILGAFLAQIGATVEFANDGEEALQLIAQSFFHLIITDLYMPKMSGCSLLEILKTSSKTKSIPVILATGEKDQEIRNKCFSLEADDYIIKPIDAHNFIVRMRRFIA